MPTPIAVAYPSNPKTIMISTVLKLHDQANAIIDLILYQITDFHLSPQTLLPHILPVPVSFPMSGCKSTGLQQFCPNDHVLVESP
jgi:hypothetical protein